MNIQFLVWRFDLAEGTTNNDFWVGLVVPSPPPCLGKRILNPTEGPSRVRSKKARDDPHQRICLELVQIVCKEEQLSKKDELFSCISAEVAEILKKYNTETLQRFRGVRGTEQRPTRIRALCIWIDDYHGRYDALQNCEHDARLFESKLQSLADAVVQVVVGPDTSRARILQQLDAFIRAFDKTTEIILLSFAGHAVQLHGLIYLLPSDFPANMDESALKDRALCFNGIYSRLCEAIAESKAAALFVIDTCRSAPPNSTWNLPSDYTCLSSLLDNMRGGSLRALTVISTSAGEMAHDGDGENSLFAEILCEELFSPPPKARTVVQASHDACIRFYEQSQRTQWPSMVGCFPGELSLTRRSGRGCGQGWQAGLGGVGGRVAGVGRRCPGDGLVRRAPGLRERRPL